MKNRYLRSGVFCVCTAICLNLSSSVVDVTDGIHWSVAPTNEIILQWNNRWLPSDVISAHLSITGMNSSLNVPLDLLAEEYIWHIDFSAALEDVCLILMTFVDIEGVTRYELKAQLAISKTGFDNAIILTPGNTEWLKVTRNALIPWNKAWLDKPEQCDQVRLHLTYYDCSPVSTTSLSSCGFFPLQYLNHPKGKCDLELSWLDTSEGHIGEPWTVTLMLLNPGLGIFLK